MTKACALVCSLGVVLLAGACTDDEITEVVLAIDSDLCVPRQLDAVNIEIVQRSGDVITQRASWSDDAPLVLPLTLSLVSKAKGGDVTVRVVGEIAGDPVVSRAARFAFVDGQRKVLPIRLVPGCRSRVCEGDTTCGNEGDCRPIALMPNELLAWDEKRVERSQSICQDGGVPTDGEPDMGVPSDGGPDMGVPSDGGPDTGVPTGDACNEEEPCGEGFVCAFGICTDKPWLSHAIGFQHMCSIFNDATGDVWCMGSNEEFRLGYEGPDSFDEYVRVEGVDDAIQVVAGARHTCAIVADGRVMCWGDGFGGQLGRGPVDLPDWENFGPGYVVTDSLGVQLLNVEHLSAGHAHTCATRPDGVDNYETLCWGDGSAGQLVYYLRDGSSYPVSSRIDEPFLRLTAGTQHNCALKFEPSLSETTGYPVTCWGNNAFGQLGSPDQPGHNFEHPHYEGEVLDEARQLAAGGNHTCMLRADRKVLCWGANEFGQCGQPPTSGVEADEVTSLGDVTQIATGAQHTCVRIGFDAYCFGNDANGRLLSDGSDTYLPRPIEYEGTVLGVWAGFDRSCVWLEETGPVCAPGLDVNTEN